MLGMNFKEWLAFLLVLLAYCCGMLAGWFAEYPINLLVYIIQTIILIVFVYHWLRRM